MENNFGLIEIDWLLKKVLLKSINVENVEQFRCVIPFSELKM
jgi:hypothetical protein